MESRHHKPFLCIYYSIYIEIYVFEWNGNLIDPSKEFIVAYIEKIVE